MSSVKVALPGMTLGAPGSTSIDPTVADQALVRASHGTVLDRQDHLGRRRQRILAQRHRHGAGMAGMAGDRDPKPAGTVDRGDDADRQLELLEHRPLLDMDLDIAQHALAPAGDGRDRRGIAAEAAQGCLEMDALRGR